MEKGKFLPSQILAQKLYPQYSEMKSIKSMIETQFLQKDFCQLRAHLYPSWPDAL